jgi:RNA polymerase sigma-70 factor (ECF subfamily)
MMDGTLSRTSLVLVGRIQRDPTDQAAWGDLVRRYGPKIYHWCRKWRLQEADAQDVTQAVLVKVVEKMRVFAYDPSKSFRAYLKTLTHYACIDFLEARKRAATGSGDDQVLAMLDTIAAKVDLIQQIEEAFDRELLEQAMLRVAQRVESRTWDAFRLLALQGLSGAEAAAQLGMKVATVFVAKSKVQKMLQEEVRKLEEPPPAPAAAAP